jgi:nicotinate-nucleotide adenylyltransferase
MPPALRPVGVFGGTFDPIHYGHLRPALELLETLELSEVRFIPCRIPVHRDTPSITAEQRLELVRLATVGQAGFVADDRELRRPGPSYMVDTLASLREEIGTTVPLCLILGSDAFRELATWRRWRELTDLAHLVVMQRPGASLVLPSELEAFVAPRLLDDSLALHERSAGSILLQPVTQLAISATQVRTLLARGQSARYLLPEAVLTHIHNHALYRSPVVSNPTPQ